ncbi:MAG: hypothetical protein PHT96_11810 [Syntrophorhabdaceae bacterium]|nr:hypothetical protein [Syntrophorhabdaceae bacterium]MDD4197070.1 hypothetical protein [Syntrophorhabdaceae bacterium]
MAKKRKTPKKTEARNITLKLRVNGAENDVIAKLAQSANMTFGRFLRESALKQTINYVDAQKRIIPAAAIKRSDPHILDLYRLVQTAGATIRDLYLNWNKKGIKPQGPELTHLIRVVDEINAKLSTVLNLKTEYPAVVRPRKNPTPKAVGEPVSSHPEDGTISTGSFFKDLEALR